MIRGLKALPTEKSGQQFCLEAACHAPQTIDGNIYLQGTEEVKWAENWRAEMKPQEETPSFTFTSVYICVITSQKYVFLNTVAIKSGSVIDN